MQQSEIDEISEAFKDAWEDYFGDLMYYVRLDRKATKFNKVYNETKKLKYDMENKIPFHGTLKELEQDDVIAPYGDNEVKLFNITLVMKELIDEGQFLLDHDDIILYEQRLGDMLVTRKFTIYDSLEKVQFNATKVFGKIKVKEVLSSRVYSPIPRKEESKDAKRDKA